MSILLVNAEALRTPLADGSVHCSASSPPYYGLRKYSGEQVRPWPEVTYPPMPGLPPLTVPAMRCALGNEKTLEAFIGHLVLCYREVKRVLRDDGVAWVVIGDGHAGSWGNYAPGGIKGEQRPRSAKGRRWKRPAYEDTTWRPAASYMPQGNIIGIPARLMFALQADGWICRNESVWHKVAPMPSSIFGTHWERHRIKVKKSDRAKNEYQSGAGTRQGAGVSSRKQREAYYEQGIGAPEWIDCPGCPKCEATGGYILRRGSWRHTRAHETILMLTKKMNYWADQEAVREPLAESSIERISQPTFRSQTGGDKDYRHGTNPNRSARKALENLASDPSGRNPRDVIEANKEEELWLTWLAFLDWMESAGPGDVLSPRPEQFAGEHYAVYPTSLLEPLLRAGCPERVCPACGSGWAPVVERGEPQARPDNPNPALPYDAESGHTNGTGATTLHKVVPTSVLGYRPTCACHASDPEPPWESGIVFDPFAGTCTTGVVARKLGMHFIGADLSGEYLSKQGRKRLELDKLSAWLDGKTDGKTIETDIYDLPLFSTTM